MGFFDLKIESKTEKNQKLCKKFGCSLCPAKTLKKNIEFLGSNEPDIYVIKKHKKAYEFSNFDFNPFFKSIFRGLQVRTGFLSQCGEKASKEVISCCEQNLKTDIEKTRPKIIIGIGEKPLNRLLRLSMNSIWRGRVFPVRINSFEGFFVSIMSPDFIAKTIYKGNIENEHTLTLEKDLKLVKDLLISKNMPKIEQKENYYKGVLLNQCRNEKELTSLEGILKSEFSNSVIGLDIETTGLEPKAEDARIISIAISTKNKTIAFPIAHKLNSPDKVIKVKKILKSFLLSSGMKIAHNLKFELSWLSLYFGKSILFDTEWGDTMAQAYLIDERQGSLKGQHPLSLDMLLKQHFGFNLKNISKVDRKNLEFLDMKKLLLYNALDAKYTRMLFTEQEKIINKKELQSPYEIQIKTARTLAITQNNGIAVDWEQWKKIKNKYENRFIEIETDLKKMPCIMAFIKQKGTFNFDSNIQIAFIFEHILKLKAIKRTKKTKSYAVDDEVLKIFAGNGSDFAKKLIVYRNLKNMIVKYIDSIPSYTGAVDGQIHTDYKALLTRTGRLSSAHPNMQNFPKRSNKDIRSFIIMK